MLDAVHRYIGTLLLGEAKYRRSRYKRARKIANRAGYEVYKPQLIWLEDSDFLHAKAEVERRGIVGVPNDRSYELLDLARTTRNIKGDIAECGVRHGKSTIFILTGFGPGNGKTYHIFDSFEGISEPMELDRDAMGAVAWTKGELAVQEQTVLQNLRGFDTPIKLHKGWIPNRFKDVQKAMFAFVHVDVDLYQPTRESFEFFYPLMSKGGIMVCDDYGSAYCPGAKKAVDEFFATRPERVLSLPTGQSLVIKE
jgi:O-methyltransferase